MSDKRASLVYDGGSQVWVPESMGRPLPDQLQGSPLEQLGELASRVCYDSLGEDDDGKRRGRSSEKLHEHIIEVRNLSVYEHATFTITFDCGKTLGLVVACANRKGVFVQVEDNRVEVTANLRAVIEWEENSKPLNRSFGSNEFYGEQLSIAMRLRAGEISKHVPNLFPGVASKRFEFKDQGLSDDQAWVSLWLRGSRGFSHEQVRHRFAVSQRSTRYVDEDGSPYIRHPFVLKYLADESVDYLDRKEAAALISDAEKHDKIAYGHLVEKLQEYGRSFGMDKFQARKQSRGAARGCLANALVTEMIFSAPVSGWKWMLVQRKNALADAEIRQVYSDVLESLKGSRYGERFEAFQSEKSPDMIGTVLV